MKFSAAAMRFFGRKPNQTLGEFAKELSDLTPADRQELAVLLEPVVGEKVED